MADDKKLSGVRDKIDAIDVEIQQLISTRAGLAQKIATVKKSINEDNSFYRPEREASVLSNVRKRNDGGVLPDDNMVHIFREIMSACLALEQPLKVAFLGPEGTFTQEAAVKHFGNAAESIDCATIEDIFSAVVSNNADYGVVPIENSTNGIVGVTLNMLNVMDLQVCGEIEMTIHHQLISIDENSDIDIIYAHQQAFDQCRIWLANHYPNAGFKAVASNALAARLIKDEKNSAAIASEYALNVYNLTRRAKNIEDKTGNSTRFLVIGKEKLNKSDNDKTTILVSTKHQSGALFDLLAPFKKHNINLIQLSSYPANTKWEYLFFIDFNGHQQDEKVKKALKIVKDKAFHLKVLGSYPLSTL